MEVYERIKELRKEHLKLSQSAFGEKLGVNRDVINNIENNRLSKPEQKLSLMKLICKEFHVNEDWLLNGNGEMFALSSPDEEVGYYVEDLLEYDGEGNPFYDMIIEMMKEYRSLDDKSKAVMRDYFGKVAEGMKKRKEEEKA